MNRPPHSTDAGPGEAADDAREMSVLEALGQTGSSSVHLREPAGDEAPLVDPSSEEVGAVDSERYHLMGEIARGGMGAVLHGRDTDLGRDVAMKVLLKRHLGEPGLTGRFVEEAQIGGQLQHPGITPVYELGLRPDRRPFFTMKLVRGRTLADLLARRPDPAAERGRFLGFFAQIVEAVAYAHSRGVIHRDLKPANVMIGAFGEVQVMDWGLAKVMRRPVDDPDEQRAENTIIATVRSGTPGAESRAGSVLGTPAYMAPEQARGAIRELDERADVFALGGILCEILTGQPTYRGKTWGEVQERASFGDTADALDRLDGCDVDPALIAIARKCLERDVADRPRHAEALHAKLASYLDSVERRRRDAARAAAEADARAESERLTRDLADRLHRTERKRRRLTAGLFAVVGFFVLIVVVAYTVLETDRRDRASRATLGVHEALGEVRAHEERAVVDRANADAHRARAVAAAARAARLAADGAVADELRRQAELVFAEAQRRDEDARQARERRRRDRTLSAELLKARLAFGPVEIRQRLSRAFRDYGIVLAARSAGEAARAVRRSDLHRALAAALDHLVLVTARGDAAGLLAVASEVDADSFRNRVRAALRTGDLGALRTMAGSDALESQPARSANLLADALGTLGGCNAAVAVLNRRRERDRGDFWHHVGLAHWLVQRVPPDHVEAARRLTIAVALEPCSGVRMRLGMAFMAAGDPRRAIDHFEEAVRLDEANAHARFRLGLARMRVGALAAAQRDLQHTARLRPDLAGVVEAVEECRRLTALAVRLPRVLSGADRPTSALEAAAFARLCAGDDKREPAARLWDRALALGGSNADGAQRFAAACAAARASVAEGVDPDEASAWRDRAIEWLRVDLDRWSGLGERLDPARARRVVVALSRWKGESALAGIRGGGIYRHPFAAWAGLRRFWSDVERVMAQAAERLGSGG